MILNSFVLDRIKCYSCKYLEELCNADNPGLIVDCQMNSPRESSYGDACYVGYSGNIQIRYCNCYDSSYLISSYLKTD